LSINQAKQKLANEKSELKIIKGKAGMLKAEYKKSVQ
jgi:hypothetical protein